MSPFISRLYKQYIVNSTRSTMSVSNATNLTRMCPSCFVLMAIVIDKPHASESGQAIYQCLSGISGNISSFLNTRKTY